MGQQQLLLLVLGIIIVGFAVLIGLQAFSIGQKQANADALVLTSIRIASDAQAWLRTPVTFGGAWPVSGTPPTAFGSLTLSLADLGYPVDGSGNFVDINGTYTAAVNGDYYYITATSATGSGDNNFICTEVTGTTADDINVTINPASTTCP